MGGAGERTSPALASEKAGGETRRPGSSTGRRSPLATIFRTVLGAQPAPAATAARADGPAAPSQDATLPFTPVQPAATEEPGTISTSALSERGGAGHRKRQQPGSIALVPSISTALGQPGGRKREMQSKRGAR